LAAACAKALKKRRVWKSLHSGAAPPDSRACRVNKKMPRGGEFWPLTGVYANLCGLVDKPQHIVVAGGRDRKQASTGPFEQIGLSADFADGRHPMNGA
jgi:hypothetical protein